MKTARFLAPAKVNYRLDVIRRRPDNYHDLRMVMQRIALYDEIEITLSGTAGIRVSCNREGAPGGPGNIAWKAADALLSRTDPGMGVDVRITKNIPVAAGLGGGSSDAATVLMGLNGMLGLNLPQDELMSVGLKLGADVPFFIFGKTALAEGVGERLTEVHGLPKVWLVLVNPNVHVSTAWVYQNLQLTKDKVVDKLPQFCNLLSDVCDLLSNDLESVTIKSCPVIQEIKDCLLLKGAAGVLMSGSGPTVFGVFGTEEIARKCQTEIANNDSWFSVVTHTI